VTTRRTRASGLLILLAGLALGLVLAGPAGASDPGPAYPPGAGADDVVTAGGGSDGAGGAGDDEAEVGDPATADNPDQPAGRADDPGGSADDEVAAQAAGTGTPGDEGRGAGPILVVVGAAVLLAGAVVSVARRL
jgi:hypothetical protein